MIRVKHSVTCNRCGGKRLLFDAYVKWDEEQQEHSIVNVMDKPVICEDCDAEVKVIWTEVEGTDNESN